jgi:hypothetical protein
LATTSRATLERMSDEHAEHAAQAEDLLSRVGDVDTEGDYQLHYLLVGAVVHALLDVADAIREQGSRPGVLVDDQIGPDGRPL